jgi:hypothetical protein
MNIWPHRFDLGMALTSTPDWRRHLYFLAALFLVTTAANDAWRSANRPSYGLESFADAQEIFRLVEMADIARSLYH